MCEREDRVAGVDALSLAPELPDGRAVVPLGVAVLYVVMNQREVMHELDRGSRWQRLPAVSTQRLARQQAERRTKALAACIFRAPIRVLPAHVVPRHLVEQGRVLPADERTQILVYLPPVAGERRGGQQITPR
jgi:hypothetical protein